MLGPQLEKIQNVFYPHDEGIVDFSGLESAWNECVNVRDLEVHDCGVEYAKAIMETPKEHVEILYVGSGYGTEGSEMKNVMDIFSEGTAGIEEIVYSGKLLGGDAFDKLITKNKSSLREFSLLSMEGMSRKKMDSYLPLFLKCPALGGVRGRRFSRNMLKTLRRRGVSCYDDSEYPNYP